VLQPSVDAWVTVLSGPGPSSPSHAPKQVTIFSDSPAPGFSGAPRRDRQVRRIEPTVICAWDSGTIRLTLASMFSLFLGPLALTRANGYSLLPQSRHLRIMSLLQRLDCRTARICHKITGQAEDARLARAPTLLGRTLNGMCGRAMTLAIELMAVHTR
jgi:hypothetical protein